ncbi:hypothetical protein PQX77_018405 [Marasmius sp. AFHP31]|nr:hypothetical protein PQX77_018405 [Marasmius sp. AFHP31]
MDPEDFYLAKHSSKEGGGPSDNYNRDHRHSSSQSHREIYRPSSSRPRVTTTFKANHRLCIVECIHSDGAECDDLFNHLCKASGREREDYLAACDDLKEGFQRELKERIAVLEKRIDELEKEKESRCASNAAKSTPHSAFKRKKVEEYSISPMDVDNAPPPAKRATTGRANHRTQATSAVPAIGFDVVDTTARPPYIDLILVENTNARAGMTSEHTLLWESNGQLRPSESIIAHFSNGTLPDPVQYSGQPSGAQMFPNSSQELQQLHTSAQQPGNFMPVIRLFLMRSVATLLRHLHGVAPDRVPAPSGTIHECLSLAFPPPWTEHTAYIHTRQHIRDTDGEQHWENHKVTVPQVPNAPPAHFPVEALARGSHVYYSHLSHFGIFHVDAGYTYPPNMQAYQLYLLLAPQESSEKALRSQYRFLCITLMALARLYRELLVRHNFIVAGVRNLVRITPDDVKDVVTLAAHFTRCGITPDEVDHYLFFGMKYCVDICRLTFFHDTVRRNYSTIFITAQYRLLFFPAAMPPDLTYQFPSDWNPEELKEYRHRMAILRLWKDSKDPRFPHPDYDIPRITLTSTSVPAPAVTEGLSAMNIDGGSADGSSQPNQGSTATQA